ncbi:hypothetical protein OFO07_01445 [Campylobacter sp. JMF_06 NA1]|uniref:hypothetical protein n=1 Tax=Campylobacter sp. JMF_06 NA1 TaxID=2983823 RepID=UPI0022E9B2F3|nr:hypothetical protein [Campylobacter sp. JMF_06 NA1]MDA3077587.1 hypothetical protein [Campylobacter sp. JMF_06 NA1]
MENENLENKPNVKKSNLRNYDENPIVMKDYGISVNIFSVVLFVSISLIGLLFGLIRLQKEIFLLILYFPIFKFIFDGYSERKNSHYYFENSKITHAKNKYLPIQELNLNDIKEIEKVTYAISPYDIDKEKIKINKFVLYLCIGFLSMIYIANFIIDPSSFLYFLFAISIIAIVIFLPTILFQIYLNGLGFLRFYDTLEIRTKNNKMLKIYIPTQWEYNEIRKYFIYKIGKDINKMQKSFFEKEI